MDYILNSSHFVRDFRQTTDSQNNSGLKAYLEII